jgi:hypothetical protein
MPEFDPSKVRDMGPEALRDAVRRLGVASLILKYLPKEGRHEYSKYIQDILARCHHHVTFDLRTKKTSDCDRSNRMPT